MRSGLGNAHIGRNLHLHPTTVTFGIYDDPVRGWEGPPMTRYIPQFSSLDEFDGSGYGFVLETAPIHPGIAAATLSWSSGMGHKRIMAQLDHLSNVIIIGRDRGGGRIILSASGRPIVHYSLTEADRAVLRRGVSEALRIHMAAGAKEVSGPQTVERTLAFVPGTSESERIAALETYVQTANPHQWRPNRFALYSAHQMSSCRMGGSPARGAIDPVGESFEVRNLFAADGSTLPTAVGRNPMLTIMAVSYIIAQHIKARLKKG